MKDKIAFENSVREKSALIIKRRKQRRKAVMCTASSVCACFIICIGVFMTMPSLTKKAFDAAAPESAGAMGADDYYLYNGAYVPDDYVVKPDCDGDRTIVTEDVAAVSTAATPWKPDVPTTTAHDTEKPKTEPSPDASEDEKMVRLYAKSATVYGTMLATHTVDADTISRLADAVFSGEAHKSPTDTHTVRVVFATDTPTDDEKYTYYLTEEDVDGIVP